MISGLGAGCGAGCGQGISSVGSVVCPGGAGWSTISLGGVTPGAPHPTQIRAARKKGAKGRVRRISFIGVWSKGKYCMRLGVCLCTGRLHVKYAVLSHGVYQGSGCFIISLNHFGIGLKTILGFNLLNHLFCKVCIG